LISSLTYSSAKMALPTPPPSMFETLRPPRLPEMRTLDRSAFTLRQPILAVRVDVAKLSRIRTDPRLRGWLMDLSKAKLVLDDKEGQGSTKLLRLKVSREGGSAKSKNGRGGAELMVEDLPEGVREFLRDEARGYVQDELVIDYEMWTACELDKLPCWMRVADTPADVLNSILPAGEAGDMAPSAFTTTGHIGESRASSPILHGQPMLLMRAGQSACLRRLQRSGGKAVLSSQTDPQATST